MSGTDRIHDFSDAHIGPFPGDVRELMAQCVTDQEDVKAEMGYAAMLDSVVGGDDAAAGCKYGYLSAISTDPRDVVERAIVASDLCRTAIRTKH